MTPKPVTAEQVSEMLERHRQELQTALAIPSLTIQQLTTVQQQTMATMNDVVKNLAVLSSMFEKNEAQQCINKDAIFGTPEMPGLITQVSLLSDSVKELKGITNWIFRTAGGVIILAVIYGLIWLVANHGLPANLF